MGCDIHMYIEYRKKGRDGQWKSFTKRLNPGRNYYMFGILAQVRSETKFSFEPKGMPDDFGYYVHDDHLIFIADSGNEKYVSMEVAKRYESYGRKIISNDNGVPSWVEEPDGHSHSWLTTAEYEKALAFYNEQPDAKFYTEPEYEAVLSAMQKFEEMGFDSRIVFWFDN